MYLAWPGKAFHTRSQLPPPHWPVLFFIPQAVGSLTGLPGHGMGQEDAINIVLSGRCRCTGCTWTGNTLTVASELVNKAARGIPDAHDN